MSVERPEKYARSFLSLALVFSFLQACKAFPENDPIINPPLATPEFTPTPTKSEINLITPPTPTEQVIFTSSEAQKEYPTPEDIIFPSPTPTVIPTSTPPPTFTPIPIPTFTPTSIPPTPTKEAITPELSLSLLEMGVYQAINELRGEKGLSTLELSPILVEVARDRSMVIQNHWSHTTPEGLMVFDLLEKKGIFCTEKYEPGKFGCSEILFRTDYDESLIDEAIEAIMDKFLNSPKHKTALLRKEHRFIGIGVAVSKDNFKYGSIVLTFPLR